MQVVNGPIGKELERNAGTSVPGRVNQANAVLGSAFIRHEPWHRSIAISFAAAGGAPAGKTQNELLPIVAGIGYGGTTPVWGTIVNSG